MKKLFPALALTAVFVTTTVIAPAMAEEKKIVGPVVKIQMGTPDAASATVLVKDNKSGTQEKIIINDEATMDKLKSKKISDGDEVRAKFDTANGVAKSFKKTAGCD